jgi:hypothetical protein
MLEKVGGGVFGDVYSSDDSAGAPMISYFFKVF